MAMRKCIKCNLDITPEETSWLEADGHVCADCKVLALQKELEEAEIVRKHSSRQYITKCLEIDKIIDGLCEDVCPSEKDSARCRRRQQRKGCLLNAINPELHHRKERPKIVCLCGSTRFYEAFQKANYDETMAGNIVLSVGFYPHSQKQAHGEDVGCTAEQKTALDELHKRKIDLADEIYVLNVDEYIGESTRSEIEYARELNKPVRYLILPEGNR